MSDLVPTRGERYVSSDLNTPLYSDRTSRHHRPFYDDYNVAKMHIMQAVGDLTDIEIFGRQVLCGVFIKPNTTSTGFYVGRKESAEDTFQSKIVMVLKKGPDAFVGTASYHNATIGEGMPAPDVGDWLFCNASSGFQISLMSHTSSRPQGSDYAGRAIDLFEWDGWPCRIISDDNFIGRITVPHSIV